MVGHRGVGGVSENGSESNLTIRWAVVSDQERRKVPMTSSSGVPESGRQVTGLRWWSTQ